MSLMLKCSRRQQTGLTLLEILIAMSLGLVLIAGVLFVFVGSKNYYRVQEGLSRVQENGQFTMGFMTRDLRMAGYQGCVSRVENADENRRRRRNTLNNSTDFLYDFFGSAVVGFEYTGGGGAAAGDWTPSLATNLSYTGAANRSATEDITNLDQPPLAGTDVLSIRTVTPTSATVGFAGQPRMQAGGSPIPITMVTDDINPSNRTGDLIIIADCDQTAVTQVTNDPDIGTGTIEHKVVLGGSLPGNQGVLAGSSVNLGRAFDDLAQIFQADLVTYYVANNNFNGEPSLWRLTNSTPKGGQNPTELIQGIEDMQILYGQDTDATPDNNANIYQTADNLLDMDADGNPDWDRVVSVRVSLLVRTAENGLAEAPQPYLFDGVVTTPPANDLRLRRVFTSTIALRNDIP